MRCFHRYDGATHIAKGFVSCQTKTDLDTKYKLYRLRHFVSYCLCDGFWNFNQDNQQDVTGQFGVRNSLCYSILNIS